MKIGVFSDSHDSLENLNKCLDYFDNNNIETALFCGDFCSPVPVKLCIGNHKVYVHAVFGNTEDRHLITQLSLTEINNLKIHGEHAELEFENRKIALTHYPLYGKGLASTGDYDAVFHGHNHTASKDIVNETLLVNPGEIMGFKEEPRFAVYDTETNDTQFVFIKDL